MENRDLDLIQQLIPRNPELARLMDEHRALEQRLDGFKKLSYLSHHEVVEQRELKKRKLAGRDEIERILIRYR